MEDMQKYPNELDDWMLSNYNYIKTTSPNLVFYIDKDMLKDLKKEADDSAFQEKKMTLIKIKNADGEEEETWVETRKNQSPDKTKGFFERAEVFKEPKSAGKGNDEPKSIAEKTQHLKEIADKIRKESAQGIVGKDTLASMIESDYDGSDEPVSKEDLESILSGNLPEESQSNDLDEVPSSVKRMAEKAFANKTNAKSYQEKTMRDIDNIKNGVSAANQRLKSGGGKFSRIE
jgi:hypothetical protein